MAFSYDVLLCMLESSRCRSNTNHRLRGNEVPDARKRRRQQSYLLSGCKIRQWDRKILRSRCCPSCAVAVRTHRRKLFHRVQSSLTWCMYTKLSSIVPQLAVDMRWNPQAWMWEEEQYRFVWSHARMLDCETVGRQYPPTLHRRSFIFVLQTVRAIG
jgi:hypothetical protein